VLGAYDVNGKLGVYKHFDVKKTIDNNVTLTVVPNRKLSVTVKDKNGDPLRGAEVDLEDKIGGTIYNLQTDAEGKVVIKNLFAGLQYGLAAKLSGYYDPKAYKTEFLPGKPNWKDAVEIIMDDARRTQNGKVVDEDGKPVTGVIVYSELGSKVKTDEKGEFTLTDLPDAEIEVHAYAKEGSGTANINKHTKDLVIKLEKPMMPDLRESE
jgi:hypothetical protein